jgi:uncharacterized membrane protein
VIQSLIERVFKPLIDAIVNAFRPFVEPIFELFVSIQNYSNGRDDNFLEILKNCYENIVNGIKSIEKILLFITILSVVTAAGITLATCSGVGGVLVTFLTNFLVSFILNFIVAAISEYLFDKAFSYLLDTIGSSVSTIEQVLFFIGIISCIIAFFGLGGFSIGFDVLKPTYIFYTKSFMAYGRLHSYTDVIKISRTRSVKYYSGSVEGFKLAILALIISSISYIFNSIYHNIYLSFVLDIFSFLLAIWGLKDALKGMNQAQREGAILTNFAKISNVIAGISLAVTSIKFSLTLYELFTGD